MNTSDTIKFYTSNTANGYKAAIALEECGIDYKVIPVDLVGGEQHQSEFQSISRFGRIPVIVIPSNPTLGIEAPFSIYGSEPIAIYLAETSGKYLPARQPERAKVLEACSVITSDLAAPLSMQFLIELLTNNSDPEVRALSISLGRRSFEALNNAVSENGYIATSNYSIADMLAFPSVHISATRYQGILDNLDALAEWYKQTLERPAVKRALDQKLC